MSPALSDYFNINPPLSFSFPFLDSIGARGTDTAHHLTIPLFRNQRRFTRFGALYPHAITHMHLPWTVDWQRFDLERSAGTIPLTEGAGGTPSGLEHVRIPPERGTPDSWGIVAARSNPRVFDCLLLNVSVKYDLLADFLLSTPTHHVAIGPSQPVDLTSCLPASTIAPAAFEHLLANLCITEADLRHLISDLPQDYLRDKAVLFYTSWNARLRPMGSKINLSGPLHECWHPYLLHPYLDLTATRFLAEQGVAAVGSDSYGFECPLYFANAEIAQPQVRNLIRTMSAHPYGIHRADGTFVSLPEYPPINLCLGSQNTWLLENLSIPSGLFEPTDSLTPALFDITPYAEQAKWLEADLGVFPIRIGSEHDLADGIDIYDCLLVQIYCWPRGRCQHEP